MWGLTTCRPCPAKVGRLMSALRPHPVRPRCGAPRTVTVIVPFRDIRGASGAGDTCVLIPFFRRLESSLKVMTCQPHGGCRPSDWVSCGAHSLASST